MFYQQLTQEQRYMIYALRQTGATQADIARRLGVHASTVSRELRRNVHRRGYRPAMAHRLAMMRRHIPRRPRKLTATLRRRIRRMLQQQWSPEQIAGRLKLRGPVPVSHQTIYNYITEDRCQGGVLHCNLRRRRRYRRKRVPARAPIRNRIFIDQRPGIVDERARIGDWEIDTVISANRKCALLSIVERVSRLTLLAKLEANVARNVARETIRLLAPLKRRVLTITADNGAEFAAHASISKRLDAQVYFAHPYHPWERGLNENTNGLVRQYLPKGIDFSDISRKEVSDIMKRLNHRPRKSLGFKTPVEVFYENIALAF